jgi:hypothetical protein
MNYRTLAREGAERRSKTRGHIYPDDLFAFAAADRLAREIYLVRPGLEGRGYSLVVTDPAGAELCRAPLDRGPDLVPD